jgi:hypothetical protein
MPSLAHHQQGRPIARLGRLDSGGAVALGLGGLLAQADHCQVLGEQLAPLYSTRAVVVLPRTGRGGARWVGRLTCVLTPGALAGS